MHPLAAFPSVPRADPANGNDSGVESEGEWIDDLVEGPPSHISQTMAKEVCQQHIP